MTVRFDEAWAQCLQVLCSEKADILESADSGKRVLVRDLMGRIHLALERVPTGEPFDALLSELKEAAGAFWSGRVLDGREMVAPEAVFQSVDAVEAAPGIWAVERLVTGADWGRGLLPTRSLQTPRAVLYGLKGGVGRSTALSVWAWHLAKLGRRVLVVDLDLESPGVSSLLLPSGASSDFGIVDWFVEDAVGNADRDLVRLMVAPSPISQGVSGKVLVAPCGGSIGSDYLSKLSRVYIDLPVEGGLRKFGERMSEMLDRLVEEHTPDIVLLDSRAGLHDLAAIATTRLGAMTFLFAAGTEQTWSGYRILLKSWAKRPSVAIDVRDRLRVVASQIPETGRDIYLERLIQSAYDLFADTLYEEAGPESPDAFNFDIPSTDAPHYPLKINWARALQDWEPTSGTVSYEELRAAYGDFLDGATELLLSGGADSGENDIA